MGRLPLGLAGLATSAAAALVVGAVIGGAARESSSTGNAFVDGDVTPMSARVSGYIAEEAVQDDQRVRAGDLLYRIDDRDYRARVAQATAELSARRSALAALDQELELQRAVISQAEALLRGAAAEAERTSRDQTRTESLLAGGWVSQARTDQVWAAREHASADLARARADLVAARRKLQVIQSERPQLEGAVSAADASLRLAQIDLASTEIWAPSDGFVGERKARVGQYVRAGTALIPHVGDRIWVTANFKETQLQGVRAGDPVRIVADAEPLTVFKGKVESLSPATGAQFALLPPDNATGNFTRIVQRIPVRIALDPNQPGLARLRPGMSARVQLERSARAQTS